MVKELRLTESQVWPGMKVILFLEGKPKPEQDEFGLVIFKCLLGGVAPIRKKFYPLEGSTQSSSGRLIFRGLEGFLSEVRFQPKQIFLPAEAPPKTEFAVFQNGEPMRYEKYLDRSVIVVTDERKRILSHNGYAYDFWECEFPLPPDVFLIPISEIGAVQVN